jgi:GNAT superfamily N-acetyltransferase
MEYRIAALTPKLGDAYLAFFDGPAFADNPDWSGCYCHYYFCPPVLDWKALGAQENRQAMAARIAVDELEGYLAYADERVVGWLNVQPRHRVPHAFARLRIEPTSIQVANSDVAMILCFVVHPEYRHRGVARALLRGALAALRERGFRLAEAYPFKGGGSEATDHYHGPRALFEEAGFSIWREDATLTVMRKALDA